MLVHTQPLTGFQNYHLSVPTTMAPATSDLGKQTSAGFAISPDSGLHLTLQPQVSDTSKKSH